MTDCIFCKIINKEIPAQVVYEDSELIAFLDLFPFEKGHTLLVPKQHYESIIDAPEEVNNKLMEVAKKLAGEYEKKLDCGFNILINHKKIAGQEIDHLHLHLIPRRIDKKFHMENKEQYQEGEMEQYKNQLKVE